jgi:four helix bundle protein
MKKIKTKNYKERVFDLEERTRNFFIRAIKLCRKLPRNTLTNRQIEQLIGAAGSVSANYCEASEAMSKKDFVKCIKICRKEAKEAISWILGLKVAVNSSDSEFDYLKGEAKELIYIFTSILSKTDKG